MRKRVSIRRFFKKEMPRVFVTDDPKLLFAGSHKNFLWIKESGEKLDLDKLRRKHAFEVLRGDVVSGQDQISFAPYAVTPAKLFIENDDAGFYADIRSFSKQELLFLLKAFSGFKRRMKSALKLFLQSDIPLEDQIPDFTNYRYKDDVHRITDAGLPRGIMLAFADERAAHSEVYALMMQSFPVVMLERKERSGRYTGPHAIGCALDEASIRDLMQRSYADERLLVQMTAGAATHAAGYNETAAAKRLAGLLTAE